MMPMDLDTRAVGFPLGGPQDGRFGFARGDNALRESIWNILLTRPGARLMRPEFGAGLGRFIHQPNTEATRALIADAARRAITRWEPRVVVLDVRATADRSDPATVHLGIEYRAVSGSRPARLALSISLGGIG